MTHKDIIILSDIQNQPISDNLRDSVRQQKDHPVLRVQPETTNESFVQEVHHAQTNRMESFPVNEPLEIKPNSAIMQALESDRPQMIRALTVRQLLEEYDDLQDDFMEHVDLSYTENDGTQHFTLVRWLRLDIQDVRYRTNRIRIKLSRILRQAESNEERVQLENIMTEDTTHTLNQNAIARTETYLNMTADAHVNIPYINTLLWNA